MDDFLPPEVPTTTPVGRSGHEKRQSSNALPKPIFVYQKGQNSIIGALVLTRCEGVQGSESIRWTASRAVALATPLVITPSMYKFRGSVFRLMLDAELALRSRSASVGDRLIVHFPEFMDATWRVFTVTESLSTSFTDPASTFTFRTPRSHARFAGIDVAVVDRLQPLHTEADEVGDNDDDVSSAIRPEADALSSGAVPRAITASDRLMGLSAPRKSGTVSHTYYPQAILHSLQLQRFLKPSATIPEVLVASGALLLDDVESQDLSHRVKAKSIHLPSAEVLRHSRLRLDLVSVIYQQQHFLRRDRIYYLLVDSSPQLGIDFLCSIEDTFDLPTPHTITAWTEVCLYFEDRFSSEIEMLSSIGLGAAGMAKKSVNIANLRLMKCKTDDDFHVRRKQNRGITSDQGASERGITDAPLSVIPRLAHCAAVGSQESFLFPNSYGLSGMLHMLYDGLETSVKKNRLYDDVFDNLQTYLAFRTDKMLVNKFVAHCCPPGCTFKSRAATHIDWKWEFMSKAMDGIGDELDFVRKNFDVDKMLTSDSGSKLCNQTVKLMRGVLDSDTFEPGQELFLTMGHVIEEAAGELETCDCHRYIWEQRWGRKRRVAEMLHATGKRSCCWMGRRLPWLVVIGKPRLLQRVQSATSPTLQTLICRLRPDRRTEILKHLDQLRTDLVEVLQAKLLNIDHVPLVFAGAFYSVYDRNWARAKDYMRRGFKEIEDAIQAGKQAKLHRTALRFAPNTSVYEDGQRFLQADEFVPIWKFPHLFVALLVIALQPCVERRIEAVHAQIKQIGRGIFGAGLPYICGAVRCIPHLDQLKAEPEFMAFAVAHWNERTLADQVLQLRFSKEMLKGKSLAEQLRLVYQTGIVEEYRDTVEQRENVAAFKIATSVARVEPVKLPEAASQSATFLKSLFSRDNVVSLPTPLLDQCRLGEEISIPPDYNPLRHAVETVMGDVPAHVFDHAGSQLFQVVNQHPEHRVLPPCHHIGLDRTGHVTLQRLFLDHPDPQHPNRVVARTDGASLVTIDVTGLVRNIAWTLRDVCFWRSKKPLPPLCASRLRSRTSLPRPAPLCRFRTRLCRCHRRLFLCPFAVLFLTMTK